ncbi:Vacuolar calcium ion transporter (High copy number undoes manganese protein 1) (Manganese resistance 1 protein) (Vacuolar Ca(2+)/H(+) exchanger) [Durusdinium trenchii]|uniref:Vacuolar calcium ion transporter (High copy number undoes manganese protein 1) (Manganese resistance 1 protein) (Vacuolar Ca(2+)/H(+) exchanger) n=1 Tax=Durusdinium trenchii TaxID=1381693 RepID=A0ABP0KC29_9DINO
MGRLTVSIRRRASACDRSSGLSLGLPPEVEQKPFWQRELTGYKQVIGHPTGLLLLLVPLGFMGRTLQWNSLIVCLVNFLAIIGMANVQARAVECVGLQVSPTIGGLVDAFLGKSVEQVMAIQCLRAGLPEVLKANLMGSLHWCLLLVLGQSIFMAGFKKKMLEFNQNGAAAQMSCQVVASISITLPTLYGSVAGVSPEDVLLLSRVCALFLIFLYLSFIYFHLKTHKESFQTEGQGHMFEPTVMTQEEIELSQLSLFSSILLMLATIVVATFNSEVLVDHLQDMCKTFNVPTKFIGYTLLPILGNTAEHIASVWHAQRDEIDISLSIAIGSATQIALFVVPLAVLWGWAFDRPMSLHFTPYDSAVMLLGTFLVAQMLQHGVSVWLHGAMLMNVYLMIVVISYFEPS